MTHEELELIRRYMMPSVPATRSDLGILFGTRHGVAEFCAAAHALWQDGMFARLLVTGGCTAGLARAEADVIAEGLLALGMPSSTLILESQATNTGENVILGRACVAQAMDIDTVRSVLVIGKACSTRRYLMTLQRHWPGPRMSAHPVNYFGVPDARWHEHAEFRARVLGKFGKIPDYLRAGFLEEIDGCGGRPDIGG